MNYLLTLKIKKMKKLTGLKKNIASFENLKLSSLHSFKGGMMAASETQAH